MSGLEIRLTELRDDVAFPPTPELAVPVPVAARRPRATRRLVLALAVVVAASAAVLAVSPGARSALRDLFGIGGVSVERADRLPVPGAPAGYLPGRRVSLETARTRVAFVLRLPRSGPVPREVLLDETVAGGAVSFVWCCEPTLQLTQLHGTDTVRFAGKVVGPGGHVEPFALDGEPAVWITGAPHVVRFIDETGTFHEARSRIAGDVLLWQDGDVTLRLEGAATRAEAVAIARDIR